MGINTPHNITLTEGQISVILCSLEDSVKKSEHYREDRVKGQLLEPFDGYVNEVDSIFEILEGAVDKYYNKLEAAKKKQPKAEWQPLKCNPIEYSKTMHNFKEFLDYCESFYSPSHPDVLYPIDGLTRGELALATLSYLDLCAASDGTVSWGDGDSLDRERVRDFVINRRAI